MLNMELDTGLAVSIITPDWYMKKFNEMPLQKTELLLKTYTGENITPIFKLLLSNCLNWKIYCDDHSSLSSTTTVHIRIISYIHYIISFLAGRYELNKLTSLPMRGFTAQLVEHRTGIAEVTFH